MLLVCKEVIHEMVILAIQHGWRCYEINALNVLIYCTVLHFHFSSTIAVVVGAWFAVNMEPWWILCVVEQSLCVCIVDIVNTKTIPHASRLIKLRRISTRCCSRNSSLLRSEYLFVLIMVVSFGLASGESKILMCVSNLCSCLIGIILRELLFSHVRKIYKIKSSRNTKIYTREI